MELVAGEAVMPRNCPGVGRGRLRQREQGTGPAGVVLRIPVILTVAAVCGCHGDGRNPFDPFRDRPSRIAIQVSPAVPRDTGTDFSGRPLEFVTVEVNRPIQVRAVVTDRSGRVLPGARIDWDMTFDFGGATWALGQSVEPASLSTDVNGEASAMASAPVLGWYVIKASVAETVNDSVLVRMAVPPKAYAELEWTRIPDMPVAREDAVGGLWNGRIYLPAGSCNPDAGVCEREPQRVMSYDPASTSWSLGATLPEVPFFWVPLAAALPDGVHFVWPGRHDVYDPATESWSSRAPPPPPVPDNAQIAAAALQAVGDTLYLVGTDEAGSVWAYDPAADAWGARAPMPTPRFGAASAVIDGLIYVAGDGSALERYDPERDSWTALAPLPFPRWGPAGGAVGRNFCVFGGDAGTIVEVYSEAALRRYSRGLPDTYCYDVDADVWSVGPPMPWEANPVIGSNFDEISVERVAAVTAYGGVYAFGGGRSVSQTDRFQVATAARLSLLH